MQPNLLPIEVPRFSRVTDFAGAWAIETGAGSLLWNRMRSTDLGRHVANAEPPKLKAEVQTIPVGRQNIAVVMLTGTLMKQASSMDESTSTVQARREIRQAAADPSVDGILLAIDSPGGTVSGTYDLGADVKAAAAKKPVFAFADELCASAAYWIASQADKVFANSPTALIGSIGTLLVVYDLSGAAEDAGVKTLVFGTGPLKGTGTPGSAVNEAQQEYLRGIVKETQVSFDAAVKKGRGMTDAQLEMVKTGGVFSANEALSLNLIDGVQTFDQTMNDLAAEVRRRQRASSASQRAESPGPNRSATMSSANNEAPAIDPVLSLRNEATRIAGIQRVAAKHPGIAEKAIAECWTTLQTENAVLKADLEAATKGVSAANPDGPHLNFKRGQWEPGKEAAPGVGVCEALEVGVRMSLGSRDLEKSYRADVLQAAHESFKGLSLHGLLMMAAVQNGYPGTIGGRVTSSNLRDVMKAAFQGDNGSLDRRADASTISMSGILGNVANKEILQGYVEEDMTWQKIATVRPVSNLQQYTSYRMLDDMEYEQVSPDGAIKHGTAGQESYTRQAYTYAKMFALTRKDMINDDLGAFQDIRHRLGRGSNKKFNKVFWTALVNNSSFFTSARTNYISGSTTNLGTDGVGLGLGVKAFRQMKSPAGTAPGSADGGKHVNADTQNPVGSNPGGRPQLLLVPPELEGNAEITYRNQNLGYVAGSAANPYQNKYEPVVAWQLSDSAYTGYSTTAWYLLNNPAYLAAIVVSFLNGMMAPTVESADADFNTLGVQFRGFHDFGCDQAEYLCGVKSKGAA
jgi:signal peptide peptidase SppA